MSGPCSWPIQPVARLPSVDPEERLRAALWPLHKQMEQAARCLLLELGTRAREAHREHR